MKRFFLLTALMAVLGLSSCEKEPSVAIIGTWEAVKMEATASGMTMTIDMVEAGKTMLFTFKADGTGSTYIESEGRGERVPFEYELYGDILTLSSDGATSGVPITIEKKTMVMEINGEDLGEDFAKLKIYFNKK